MQNPGKCTKCVCAHRAGMSSNKAKRLLLICTMGPKKCLRRESQLLRLRLRLPGGPVQLDVSNWSTYQFQQWEPDANVPLLTLQSIEKDFFPSSRLLNEIMSTATERAYFADYGFSRLPQFRQSHCPNRSPKKKMMQFGPQKDSELFLLLERSSTPEATLYNIFCRTWSLTN